VKKYLKNVKNVKTWPE